MRRFGAAWRPAWSLRRRLLLLTVVVPLPLVLLLCWGIYDERVEALTEARHGVVHDARIISDHYRRMIQHAQDLAATLATLPAVRRGEWAAVNEVFASVAHRFPAYPNIRISDMEGRMLASALPDAPATSNAGRDWFDAVIRTGSYAISEPFHGVTTRRPVTVLGYPVKSHANGVLAVLSITIDMTNLTQLPTGLGREGVDVTVIAPQGTVMARWPADPALRDRAIEADVLRTLQEGPSEGLLETDRLNGVPSVVAYRALPISASGPPVVVTASVPRHLVLDPVDQRLALYAGSTFLVCGLVLMGGLAGSRVLIARPVNTLLQAMRRMATGDLQSGVEPPLLSDPGEFGQLARTLLVVRDSLQARDAEQAAARDRLRAILDGYPGVAALVSAEARVVEINAWALGQLGRDRAQVLCRLVDELPWDATALAAELRRLVARALAGETVSLELPAELPGAPSRVIGWHLTPVGDADGRVSHVAVFGVDVTEMRASEQALRASRRELAGVFEGTPVGLASIAVRDDGGFQVLATNPALRGLGACDDVLPRYGRPVEEMQPVPFWRAVHARCRAALESPGPVVWSDLIRTRSANRHVHVSLSRSTDELKAGARLICSIRDVTVEYNALAQVRDFASRMALILNTTADVQLLFRADESFTIEAVNRAFLDLARRRNPDAGDPVGRRLQDVMRSLGFTSDELAKHAAALTAARDHGSASSYTFDMTTPDMPGVTREVRVAATVRPHIGAAGRPTHVLWSGRDVTNLWRAEQALRRSEARLLRAQQIAEVGCWEVDVDSDTCYWSEEAYRILEMPPDTEPGRELFLAHVHPEDRVRVERALADGVRHGTPLSLTHRLLLPSGRVKIVEQHARINVDPTRPRPILLGTVQDITGLMAVQEALRASEANLVQAEMLAELGHYHCDADGANLHCSAGLLRLFDLPAAPPPRFADLLHRLHPEDAGRCAEALQTACRGGDAHDHTCRIVRADQTIRQVRTRLECRPSALGRCRLFATVIDVTEIADAERRLAELNETLEQRVAARTRDLESSNRELESFSYSVSHDLRAPLRAIEGFTHAAIESDAERLSSTGLALLRRAQAAARRMATLIDALLRLSGMTREPLAVLPVDVSALARSVVEELRQATPAHRPVVTIADGLTAVADPRHLRVALTNLLDNAFKFSERVPQAIVEFGSRQIDGRDVFFVRDNGVGFEPAAAARLFEPFERLHPSSEYAGTGIGLATVHRVVQRHGGRLWAESTPGGGATFYFTLGGPSGERSEAT